VPVGTLSNAKSPEKIVAKNRLSLHKAVRTAKAELAKYKTGIGQFNRSCPLRSKMFARKHGTETT
jgi:hypothetical protein